MSLYRMLQCLLSFSLFFEVKGDDQLYPTFREIVLENSTIKYNKKDSPFDVYHKQIVVKIKPTFVVLTNVIEIQQLVSYIVNIQYTWKDPRLYFNPNDLGTNITIIPSNLVWIPTIDCFNCIDVHMADKETDSNEVSIESDGTVLIVLKAHFYTICNTTVETFPFNTIFCGLDFSSGLSTKDKRVVLDINATGQPNVLLGTAEWNLYFEGLLGANVDPTGVVSIRFRLERNSEFYVILLILPTMIVTSTCLLALTLPLDFAKGEKYTMGISGLLGLTFLLGIVIAQVPRSQNIPIIANWLLIEMFLVVFTILIDLPVREIKKCCVKRAFFSDKVIDLLLCLIVFTTNVLATILMFTLRPSPVRDFIL